MAETLGSSQDPSLIKAELQPLGSPQSSSLATSNTLIAPKTDLFTPCLGSWDSENWSPVPGPSFLPRELHIPWSNPHAKQVPFIQGPLEGLPLALQPHM